MGGEEAGILVDDCVSRVGKREFWGFDALRESAMLGSFLSICELWFSYSYMYAMQQ